LPAAFRSLERRSLNDGRSAPQRRGPPHSKLTKAELQYEFHLGLASCFNGSVDLEPLSATPVGAIAGVTDKKSKRMRPVWHRF
jgi:hypothetical protein